MFKQYYVCRFQLVQLVKFLHIFSLFLKYTNNLTRNFLPNIPIISKNEKLKLKKKIRGNKQSLLAECLNKYRPIQEKTQDISVIAIDSISPSPNYSKVILRYLSDL